MSDGLLPSKENSPNSFLAPMALPKLSELPDELLLKIALSVDDTRRNQVLRNLALTSRRFRAIAQEVLIRNAVVTPETACDYLDVLCEHPEYVRKLSSSLQLHAKAVASAQAYPPWSKDRSFIGSKCYHACLEIMDKIGEPSHRRGWAQDLSVTEETIRSGCLAIVILIRPKLHHLSLTDVFIRRCWWLHKMLHVESPIPEYTGWRYLVFKALTHNLQSLEVVATKGAIQSPPLRLERFRNLRHLSIATTHLVWEVLVSASPLYAIPGAATVVPTSLETLHIHVMDNERHRGYVFQWLEKVHRQQKALLSLRTIHLFLKATLTSFQHDLQRDSDNEYNRTFGNVSHRAEELLGIPEEMKKCNIDVQMFFLQAQKQLVNDRVLAVTGHDMESSSTYPEPDTNDLCNFHQVRCDHALNVVQLSDKLMD